MDTQTEKRLTETAARCAAVIRSGGTVTIPRPRPRDAGGGGSLLKVRGRWCARLRVNKQHRFISLGTADKSEAAARLKRFYTMLREAGATDRSRPGASGDRYVYDMTPRKPWLVKIGGTTVGRYATREKAVAARDEHLAILDDI